MKKNKLYTANKWNRPAFMPEPNIFAGGGWTGLAQADKEANPWNYADDVDTTQQYMQSENAFGISKADNPFSKGNLQGGLKSMANTPIGGSMIGAVGGLVGNALNKGISGGLSSGAGNAIGSIGSTVGGALSSVNPLLGGIVSVGSGIIGGGINALFGSKVDEAKLNAAKAGTAAYNNFVSNASSFDGIQGLTAQANVQDAYKGGLFSSGSARRKNEELRRQREEARMFAERSIDNNIFNLQNDQLNNELANFSAFGGPIETSNMGAIEYGFMSDYLTQKKKETEAKNKMLGISTIPAINTFGHGGCFNPFALGGDVQMHGADFTNGLISINAGGSHEANPNEGVQLGVDPEGTPNLVEEGETIFDDEDYVFSNRIHPKKEVLKKFHMYSKGGKLTYADVSKRLEKEAKERPNDPISKASLKDMLTMLMDAQEQQKAEEEAKEAKKAFEALSPEEQKAVLEQIAQQQQVQANAEQQINPQEEQEVPVDENGNPIEQTEEMPNQEDIAQNDEGSMSAYGGKINKFDKGGSFKDKLISALGFPTFSDFNKWAEENKVDFDDIDWDAIEKNPLSMNFDIIAKRNPALADALKNNYDFGAYTPSTNGYDLAAFAKALNNYTKSKTRGNTAGNYAIDKDFGLGNYKTIEDLENSEAYKNYTNALVNVANAAQGQKFKLNNGVLENIDGQNFSDANLQLLNTLYNTTQGTSTFDKGKPVPMFIDNGDGTYSIAKNAKNLLIGADGKSGLRYDHKGGIFHLTPTATTRGTKVVSRVINDDGTVEDIIGDVPTAWGKPVNTYSWNDPENSYTYNYYKRPQTDANGNAVDDKETKLPYKNEKWRYAGLLGPAIGLGLWSAGVGKPNTKGLDAAMEYASQANGKADYMPIGDYLRYNPLDIWYAQNSLNAQSRATDRALANNSGGNRGTAMAGLIANGYNSQIADANLFRQAQEYNDAQRQKVAEFNRGTNMFNADAYNKTSQTNAELQNRNAQFRANLAAQIANQKMNADSQWYNALYGNIGELANGLSEYGRENAQYNMIAAMANNGVFGTPASEWGHYSGTKKDVRTPKNKASKGGKLKRRKGLTF